MTIEQRKKMSDAHLGKKTWNAGTKGMSIMKPNKTSFQKGRKHTEEFKKNASLRMKGNKYALGFKQSEELKERRASKIRGENHGRWLKDRTKLKQDERRTQFKNGTDSATRAWSKEVKKRDNWTCVIHNSECSGRLESHHILNWLEYPDVRYNINNGVTLCHFHHPKNREQEADFIGIAMDIFHKDLYTDRGSKVLQNMV